MNDSESLIGKHLKKIFECVHPSFKKIFFSKEIKPILNQCIKELDDDLYSRGVTSFYTESNGIDAYIRPAAENIMRAFCFDANNLRVIIVGQDPYPKSTDAMGMSFSVPKSTGTISKSLENIFEALENSGYISGKPNHGYLGAIANQGVLFINRYLTRCPEIETSETGGLYVNGNGNSQAKYLHKFWAKFTDAIVNYLTGEFLETDSQGLRTPCISVMLWGKPAQAMEKVITASDRVHILKWQHPSPMANTIPKSDPNHFVNCDHFKRANDILRSNDLNTIAWNPDVEETDVTKDQFYTMRVRGMITADPSAELTDDEKKKIFSLLKSGLVYDDGTDTTANMYIRLQIEKRKKALADKKRTHTEPEPEPEPATPETPEEQEPELAEPETPEELERVVMFTDGACQSNGNRNASKIRAGYAAWFPSQYDGLVNGIIPDDEDPAPIAVYGKLPETILSMKEGRVIRELKTPAKQTNQRAEVLAVIQGIEEVLRAYKSYQFKKPVLIISDSEYALRYLSYLLWQHQAQDKNFKTVKENRDLAILLYRSLSALSKILPTSNEYDETRERLMSPQTEEAWKNYLNNRKKYPNPPNPDPAWMGLTIMHQRAHLDRAPAKDTPEWERWEGNRMADEYAVKGCDLVHTDVVRV